MIDRPVWLILLVVISLNKPANDTMYYVEWDSDDGTNTIEFNFCGSTNRLCPDWKEDYANIIDANNTCNHLSKLPEDSSTPGRVDLISNALPEFGVNMIYEGNHCNETHLFTLNI